MYEQYLDQVLGVGKGETVIVNVFFLEFLFESQSGNHPKKYLAKYIN
jgi:hypothetical protein